MEIFMATRIIVRLKLIPYRMTAIPVEKGTTGFWEFVSVLKLSKSLLFAEVLSSKIICLKQYPAIDLKVDNLSNHEEVIKSQKKLFLKGIWKSKKNFF